MAKKNGTAGITKADAVRQAFGLLGKKAMPLQVQAFLREKFSVEMNTNAISGYKTAIFRKGKGKKKPSPTNSAPAAAHSGNADGIISLSDVQAARHLIERIGVAQLKGLIEILAK